MSNFEHIFGPVYVVKNDKGFDRAVKHYTQRTPIGRIVGTPTNFPSMVAFSMITTTEEILKADCEHMTLVKARLEKI